MENQEVAAREAEVQHKIIEQIGNCDQSKLNLAKATTIISRIAWLVAKIEDLEREISAEGVIDEYTNGQNQSGRKVSSKVQVLSTFEKQYSTLISQLFGLIKNADDKKAPVDLFGGFSNHGQSKRQLP